MTAVYINDDGEPYVLEEDGRLDLSGFGWHHPSISLQGKKGLVNEVTGITKQKWAELLEILPADGQAKLGTQLNPLQVKGARTVGSGRCLLFSCILHKTCVLPQIQCYSVYCRSLASEVEQRSSIKQCTSCWLV